MPPSCMRWSRNFPAVSVKLPHMNKEIPALTQAPASSKAVEAEGSSAESRPDAHVIPGDDEPGSAATSAAPPPAPPPAGSVGEPSAAKPSRAPLVLSILALAIAAAAGWQVFEQRLAARELRSELAERLNGADVGVAEVRGVSRQGLETIAAIQSRLGVLDAKVAANEGQAAALEALYQEYSRSRSDQLLAEIEQSINIAAQQLQLAGNFESALIALEGAESRLAGPDQAHLQTLRRALIKDIDAVRAHPRVDVSGLALKIELLLEKVDGLPLAYGFELDKSAAIGAESAPVEDAPSTGVVDQSIHYLKTLAADVWDEVRTMVRLERLDRADPALLAPAQGTFLREHVKIRLLTARLALMARDGATYSSDLSQARQWMERFFDPRDEGVVRAIAELAELEKLSVGASAPTLEETFAALRILQARPTSQVAPAAGRAPDPTPDAAPAAQTSSEPAAAAASADGAR